MTNKMQFYAQMAEDAAKASRQGTEVTMGYDHDYSVGEDEIMVETHGDFSSLATRLCRILRRWMAA